MTERKKTVLLWVLIAVLLLLQLLLLERQGGSAVKYLGRLCFMTVLICSITQSRRRL